MRGEESELIFNPPQFFIRVSPDIRAFHQSCRGKKGGETFQKNYEMAESTAAGHPGDK